MKFLNTDANYAVYLSALTFIFRSNVFLDLKVLTNVPVNEVQENKQTSGAVWM